MRSLLCILLLGFLSSCTVVHGDATKGTYALATVGGDLKDYAQTANGITLVYKVKLDTIRLGDITLNNVDGIVMENNQLGQHGLLGMSFLNRTEMRRDGDSMTLTRRF